MRQAMLSRRRMIALMTVAMSAAATGFDQLVPFLAARGDRARDRAIAGQDGLAALCSDLRCSDAIRNACLHALPAVEASPEDLARLILADLSEAGDRSAVALRHSVREQSRRDFGDGRVVNVEGWMLSLTETRVYALAVLLAAAPDQPTRYPIGASRNA